MSIRQGPTIIAGASPNAGGGWSTYASITGSTVAANGGMIINEPNFVVNVTDTDIIVPGALTEAQIGDITGLFLIADSTFIDSDIIMAVNGFVRSVTQNNDSTLTVTSVDADDNETDMSIANEVVVRTQHSTEWVATTPPASLGAIGSLGIDDSGSGVSTLFVKINDTTWTTLSIIPTSQPLASLSSTRTGTTTTVTPSNTGDSLTLTPNGAGDLDLARVNLINDKPFDILEYVSILGRSLPSEVTEIIPVPTNTPSAYGRVFQYDYTVGTNTTSHFRLLHASILGSERLTLASVAGAIIFEK